MRNPKAPVDAEVITHQNLMFESFNEQKKENSISLFSMADAMSFAGKHAASAAQQRLMRKFFLPRSSQPEEKSRPEMTLMALQKSMATALARFVSRQLVCAPWGMRVRCT